MAAPISKVDHVAITTDDLAGLVAFYVRVLGAEVDAEHEREGTVDVVRLSLGGAMLNIHRAGHGHWLVARRPTPGAVDICFRWDAPIADAVALLNAAGVPVIEGPVDRVGSGRESGRSVYFLDPDGNLLELLTTSTD